LVVGRFKKVVLVHEEIQVFKGQPVRQEEQIVREIEVPPDSVV
jgi:hypothetical protein